LRGSEAFQGNAGETAMALIFWYLGFMILGDLLAYLLGLFVEREWGSQVSLLVFLFLYFAFLWISWLLAVRVTDPGRAKRNTATA
jgi:hypothetical protein